MQVESSSSLRGKRKLWEGATGRQGDRATAFGRASKRERASCDVFGSDQWRRMSDSARERGALRREYPRARSDKSTRGARVV